MTRYYLTWLEVSKCKEEKIRTKSNQTDSTTRQEPDRHTKWIANISELHFFPRRYVLANHKAIKTMPDHIWQTKSSPQPYLRARLLIHGRCFLQLAFFISPTYGFSCLFAPSLILLKWGDRPHCRLQSAVFHSFFQWLHAMDKSRAIISS